jgi:hypothetical protein
MQQRPQLARKSSLTSHPMSARHDNTKYITKKELDEMLGSHFVDAVDKLKSTIVDTLSQVNRPELSEVIKERDFYKEKCEKLRESRYQDHNEFSKIIAEYQKILIDACDGLLKKSEDTGKGLRNIGVMRRNSSAVDVESDLPERYRSPGLYK